MDDAGAALAGVTADMGAGQVQMLAQEMDKKGSVLDVGRDRLAVYRQFDCGHADTSRCSLFASIRSTGAGLCNWDFHRGSHSDVAGVVRALTRTTPNVAHHAGKFVPFSARSRWSILRKAIQGSLLT